MKENFEKKGANDVASLRKKYVSPVNLDEQPKLLSASGEYNAGFNGIARGSCDDEE